MNICFFSQEYPPETHSGGMGTYTFNMAGALVKLGHTVHVITSTKTNERTIQDNGVWVHRIKKHEMGLKELSLFKYSYTVSRKVSMLNCSFDIVQSSEYGSEGFCFSLKKKSPLITRLATPYFLIEKINGKVFLGPRPFFNWMEKKQTLRSDGIFTSTKAIAKAVGEEWGIDDSKVQIIPNSLDLSRIIKLGEGADVPDMLSNKSYLMYFGRLEERKGVHVLAQALPRVFDNFPDLNMVFVGSDDGFRGASMKEYVRKETYKYQDRIIYLDNMQQEKLFPIVHSAKIVILPSLWEAFGFVSVEAMTMGRPVIATSGSGFEEIIEDEVSGYLVEPGSVDSLSDKIIRCLNNEEGLRRVSEGARERAKDFEVTKIASRLLAYYENIQSNS